MSPFIQGTAVPVNKTMRDRNKTREPLIQEQDRAIQQRNGASVRQDIAESSQGDPTEMCEKRQRHEAMLQSTIQETVAAQEELKDTQRKLGYWRAEVRDLENKLNLIRGRIEKLEREVARRSGKANKWTFENRGDRWVFTNLAKSPGRQTRAPSKGSGGEPSEGPAAEESRERL